MTKIPDAVSKVHPNHPILTHDVETMDDTAHSIHISLDKVRQSETTKYNRAAALRQALDDIDKLSAQVVALRALILDLYGK